MVSPEPTRSPGDPVAARRARIAHWVGLAKRLGYALLLLAVIAVRHRGDRRVPERRS